MKGDKEDVSFNFPYSTLQSTVVNAALVGKQLSIDNDIICIPAL